MAQEYDRTMKQLTSLFASDYVELALGDTAEYRGLVTIEDSDKDKELPSLSRADAYVALQVLSGIVYPPELVYHILTRREVMLESPVYAQFIEEGRKEGREEGREEGWENALHENILTLLTLRLGAVPEELAAQVHQVKGAERLEALFRCAALVDRVADFTQALAG